MTNPTSGLAEMFAELFRNRSRKLTPDQVAEKLGTSDAPTVRGAMETIFFADLLHMTHIKVDGRYVWHYGITARARRIVAAVGLDGVTDEVIRTEYRDAMAWRPRKNWEAPAAQAA